jgi:hypothetical protein
MKTKLPEKSILNGVPHDYLDSYDDALNASKISIEQVGKAFFASSPAWVDWLFDIRNRVVSMLGLKTSGAESKEAVIQNIKCEVGESIGLFKIFAKTENEIVMGEDDKHLDFRVSLFLDRQNNLLVVSTIVKIHNWLGRLYFLPVKPFHKIIVPVMTKGITNEINKA